MQNLKDLNDDCLYIVFENLDISGQYNLACVCKRFEEVFKLFGKISFRHINLRTLNAVQRNNEEHFLKLIGSMVKIWDGTFDIQRLENVSKYCTNLQAVRLDYCYNWPLEYFEYLFKMKSLTTIYIYTSHFRPNGVSFLISVLQQLPNLKHLSLNTLQLIGKHINNLCGLKTLVLNIDRFFNTETFINCCISLKKLERLELKRLATNHFTSETFQAMVDHCKNLQMLLLTVSSLSLGYEIVAKLPKLKYFILNCVHLRSEMIEALVEYKANDLILLRIPSVKIKAQIAAYIGKLTALRELQCGPVDIESFKHLCNLKNLEILNIEFTPITDNILLMLLTALPKLRLVDLYHCLNITSNVVHSILKLLEERAYFDRGIFRHPLELCVKDTNIDSNILENPELLQAKHLLRLNMELKTNYSLKFERIFDYCN